MRGKNVETPKYLEIRNTQTLLIYDFGGKFYWRHITVSFQQTEGKNKYTTRKRVYYRHSEGSVFGTK